MTAPNTAHTTTAGKQGKIEGKIAQVIGPVVDVEFAGGDLPEIHTALRISNPAINDKPGNLVVEVAQHLGEHHVRCIAMDTTASNVASAKDSASASSSLNSRIA